MAAVYLWSPEPNPVTDGATIRFEIPQSVADAKLAIHDVSGRSVKTLVRGCVGLGGQLAHWDTRDETGPEVAAGVYFIRLDAGIESRTRKALVLR